MYDIKPLEEQWLVYNRKRKRPLYIRTLLFIILMIVGFFFYENRTLILDKFSKINKQKTKLNNDSVFLDSAIDVLSLKQKGINVKPIQEKNDDNPMNPEDVYVDESIPQFSDKNYASESKKKAKKKMHLEIIEMSGESVYVDVKNRFSLAPDPDDSLFLARNYFKDGKYRKASHWALETNKLNGDIEESWLIFAQAKAKSGQKNEAIRVLSAYVAKLVQ